jgi:serine/threonine protein kinase
MLTGLAEAHEAGLIHRDLKPGNVMLNQEGRAILMDFGLAKRDGETSLTEDGILLGTPDYMSPEHAQGHALDSRTDLYSMGVVLFHMLSGRVPYAGKSSIKVLEKHVHEPVPALNEIVHDLPEGLSDVVTTLMAKKPEERFQTAGEVIDALQDFVSVSSGIKAGPSDIPDSEERTYVEETLAATESSSLPNLDQSNKPKPKSMGSAATVTSKGDSQRADQSRTQLVIVFVGGAAACALCLLLISGISRLVGKKPSAVPVVNDTSTTIDRTTNAALTTSVRPAPPRKVRIEFLDGRTLEGELVRIDAGGNVSVEVGTAGRSQLVQLKMERIKTMVAQD